MAGVESTCAWVQVCHLTTGLLSVESLPILTVTSQKGNAYLIRHCALTDVQHVDNAHGYHKAYLIVHCITKDVLYKHI